MCRPPLDPDCGSSEHSNGGAMARTISCVARHNTVLTIAVASVAPILYLAFIDHNATNSFYDDDGRSRH